MTTRVFPHSPEAEASILGGIMQRNDALARLPDLEPDAFYDNKHRVVFAAMRNLEARSTPIDVVTLEVEIGGRGKLEAIGGVAFLGELSCRIPTMDNVVLYAGIVTKLAQAREMMLVAGEVAELGYEIGLDDPVEYLQRAESAVLTVARRGSAEKPRHVGQLVRDRVKSLDEVAARRAAGGSAITGVPTGIVELDKLLGGYPRKVPTIVAGRPKMGKSSMAIAAAAAATASGIGAMVFSLEDGWESYADSLIARESDVPTERLRAADLQRGDLGPIARAVATLRKCENWRFDERVLDAPTICRELRRAKAEIPNFGLGIVDYVQLVRRNPRLNEDQALREIMGNFAAIAKELDIALIVLSQLNRELEKREDKRPTLADLRGSGSLEEVAKVILFMYRGAYYYGTPKKEIDYECDCVQNSPCSHRPSSSEFDRTIQVIIAANNQGQTGRVFATWAGPQKRIS